MWKKKIVADKKYNIDNEKLIIEESKSADSRSAENIITKEQLMESNHQHINDVKLAMNYFADRIRQCGENHDFTKVDENFKDFYDSFHRSQVEKDKSDNFKEEKWFKNHLNSERHHIEAQEPENVNLFDVLEHIADICMAAMGRTGKFERKEEINPDLLVRAYNNTIDLLLSKIEIK